jgi:signal transduction histidine kinase
VPQDTVRAVQTQLARKSTVEIVVVAFAGASVAELFIVHDVRERPALVVFALLWSLPLLAYRRNQLLALFVVLADLVGLGLVEGQDAQHLSMPFVAGMTVAVLFGFFADRRLGVAGWIAVVAAAAIVDYRSSNTASGFVWPALIFTLSWFFGVALGNRTAQAHELRARVAAAEVERHAAAEVAAADERARIARELNDVVAHSVSVMVVQASGVRRLLSEDQEREREALRSVERSDATRSLRCAECSASCGRAKKRRRRSRRNRASRISTG